MSARLQLSVVLYQQQVGAGAVWLAQCLEHSIVGHGPTVPEALADFERTAVGEIVLALEHGEEPLAGIGPAPARFHEMWSAAIRLADPITVTPAAGALSAASAALAPFGEAEVRLAA